MGNDTYLGNSDVIKKLDDLSAAVGGTTVPTTTTKTNTDFVIGINKSIDAASGRTGVEYPPYSHNTLVTDKLDELAEAIAEGGGGGPGPTPVMGALSVTENGDYLPSSYNYDGFSSVSVDVPEPPTPVMGTLSVTANGDYLPSSYNYDGFSSVSVNVPAPPAPTPFVPEFEETALWYTGEVAETVTLSQDYHGFDLVKFRLYNRNTYAHTDIYTTPAALDAIYSKTSYMALNEFATNYYLCVTYNPTTLTFTKDSSRSFYFRGIYGLNCSNATMTKTEIYQAANYTSSNVTVDYNDSLYQFDHFLIVANGGSDEVQPCYFIVPGHFDNEDDSNAFSRIPRVINPYNSTQKIMFNSEHQLSSAKYFRVEGIKFTPN